MIQQVNSFEELKYNWYEKDIKINVDHDPILVIVANKNDSYDKNEVKDEEGRAFAEEIQFFNLHQPCPILV